MKTTQLPFPEHPGVVELAALGALLRASDLAVDRQFDVMSARAESLGFETDGAAGIMLALSVAAATGDLPTGVPNVAKLAKVNVHRLQ